MNENIDLTKILKNCPKETELYSPMYGKVYFNCTFYSGDDGIFYLLPTLYYDKNWERVCFGLFSIFVEFKIGVKEESL